jgi:hypothetical protein
MATFPAPNTIPPPCFFTIEGLPAWLNQNPSYKEYFVGTYPTLVEMTSSLSTIGYDTSKVPLPPTVTNLSDQQYRKYQKLLDNFRKVYAFNSNAYVTSKALNTTPVYAYLGGTYAAQTEHREAVGLVNRLYPLRAMAGSPNAAGSTLGWVIPFPI